MAVTIERVKPSFSAAAPPSVDFEAVFNDYWPRIYAVLFRLTGDADTAQDLALEVFWRLHHTPPPRHDPNSLGGWLYRVAINLGYNALRAARRRQRYEQEAGIQVLESDAPPDPATETERRLERQRVRQALRGLKPQVAQILILRHSGLAYAEIAATLGIPSGSVGTLLARAQRQFEIAYQKLEA